MLNIFQSVSCSVEYSKHVCHSTRMHYYSTHMHCLIPHLVSTKNVCHSIKDICHSTCILHYLKKYPPYSALASKTSAIVHALPFSVLADICHSPCIALFCMSIRHLPQYVRCLILHQHQSHHGTWIALYCISTKDICHATCIALYILHQQPLLSTLQEYSVFKRVNH